MSIDHYISRRRLLGHASVAAGSALFTDWGRAATPTGASAITNVSLLPMDREVVLERQSVLIADGVITKIGPAATTAIPRGAAIIDGTARFLMPGLVDMHTHFLRPPEPGADGMMVFPDYLERNIVFGLLSVAHGVTSVRCLWGHREKDLLARRFEQGDLLGPTIYSSGPITDGAPPIWKGARVVTTPEAGRAAVRQDKAAGRVSIKIYDGLSADVYRAIVDEARRLDLLVVGHIPAEISLTETIAARQASIEHAESFLVDLQPDPSQASSKSLIALYRDALPAKLADVAPAMKAAGMSVCPTIVVGQMDWRPPHPPASGMRYFPDDFVARYRQAWEPDKFPDGEDELRFGIEVVRVLHAGGVGILAGTDMFKFNVVPGEALLQELGYYTQAGLTPYETLRTATSNPAQFLRKSDQFGSVVVGRRADLLLLEANPLDDLANISRRTGVMTRGRWHSESMLQKRLGDVAQAVASSQSRHPD